MKGNGNYNKSHDTPVRTAEISTPTPPSAGEDVGPQEPPFTAGGNANGAATLEGSLAVPHTTKRGLTIRSAFVLLGIYPKEGKRVVTQNLHMDT